MTWTYDDALGTDLDKVRSLCGDTNTQQPLLSDAQVTWALSLTSNLFLAAAHCCDLIVAKYAREVDHNDGVGNTSRTQRHQQYRDLAAQLRAQASTAGAAGLEMYAGGLSLAEADTDASDTDLVQPSFTRDRDANGR